jgi:hypothetical protein
VRRPMVMRSRATDGRSASKCQRKWPDRRIGRHSGRPERQENRAGRLWLPGKPRRLLPSTPCQGSSGECRLIGIFFQRTGNSHARTGNSTSDQFFDPTRMSVKVS